ncbi:Substrate-specific component FolT of folate ECF transporter [Alkalibacterium sp. AK22]|uniref:folate family ECF transporter S component n=1 Tax=Alkalibacterium sp. AK22 TaxID=1229520 RepID=UPI000452C63C|nr:folate family ECF transporter S component [Alkalibacterium sp. AK22]EXJ24018.1 Substrate-specific component FolT of folate ECF transporter [Alkalibacterium sp. AK22]
MTATPHTGRRQNKLLHYGFMGMFAPFILSFLIPYLRAQSGLDGLAYLFEQTGDWQMILMDVLFLLAFTGLLLFLTVLISSRIEEDSLLPSLLLGLLFTAAPFVFFLQRERLQIDLVHEGSGLIYAIAFLYYVWLLIYRAVRLSRWTMENRTLGIAIVGLLVAMNISLGMVGITTPIVRITFAFLPTALIGLLFGPWVGGFGAVLADILSFIIGPGIGGFFPGFTLSAFLTGLIYGLFLHKREVSLKRIITAEVVIALFVNLTLNTLWLRILTQNPIAVLLPPRLIQNAVTIVIRIATIRFIASNKQLKRVYMKFSTART